MILVLSLAHGACPALGPVLDRLQRDLEDVRLDAAETDLEGVREAIGCGGVIATPEAARLHALSGVRASLLESPEAAGLAFVTARALDPTLDLSAFGPSLAGAFAAVRPSAPVALTIDPTAHAPWSAWVDGRPAGPTVVPGAHVIQVVGPDDTVRFGSLVVAEPLQPLWVDTFLVHVVPPTVPVRERRSVLPALGIATLTVGVAGLLLSVERANALKSTSDAESLERRWLEHRVSRVGGLGLVGLGGGLVVLGVL